MTLRERLEAVTKVEGEAFDCEYPSRTCPHVVDRSDHDRIVAALIGMVEIQHVVLKKIYESTADYEFEKSTRVAIDYVEATLKEMEESK